MRDALHDSEHQLRLDRFGFTVVPFLGPAAIEQLRTVWEELGPAPGDPQMALYFGFHSESPDYKRAVVEAVRPIVESTVQEMFDEYEVFFSMFIAKWPGPRSGFGPHQDPSLVDERAHRGLTVWCPLGPTGMVDGVDNGTFHVVPGSHSFSSGLRVHDASVFQFQGREQEILDRHGVSIPTRTGEAIIFDHRLVHYSMPNATQEPRVCLGLGMRPREASCLHLRYDAVGRVEVYPVKDDFFIDVSPFALNFGVPGYEMIETVDPPGGEFDSETFAELCESVGPAPGSMEGYRSERGPTRANADPFCFLCGTTEGLEHLPRVEAGNVQVLCPGCVDDLEGRYDDGGYALDDHDRGLFEGPIPTSGARRLQRAQPELGPKMRILLTGAEPPAGPDSARLHRLIGELGRRSDTVVQAVWLLGGDERVAWEQVADRQLVLDDLRTWGPGVAVERLAGHSVAAKLRGAARRLHQYRMGEADVVIFHQGIGERVLERLVGPEPMSVGLWTSGESCSLPPGDDVRRDFDLVLSEVGSRPPLVTGRAATISLGSDATEAYEAGSPERRLAVREGLSFDSRPLVVGYGVDPIEARTDIFMESFRLLRDEFGIDARGAWVGFEPSSDAAAKLREHAAMAGLGRWLRVFEDRNDVVAAGDLLLVTSASMPDSVVEWANSTGLALVAPSGIVGETRFVDGVAPSFEPRALAEEAARQINLISFETRQNRIERYVSENDPSVMAGRLVKLLRDELASVGRRTRA